MAKETAGGGSRGPEARLKPALGRPGLGAGPEESRGGRGGEGRGKQTVTKYLHNTPPRGAAPELRRTAGPWAERASPGPAPRRPGRGGGCPRSHARSQAPPPPARGLAPLGPPFAHVVFIALCTCVHVSLTQSTEPFPGAQRDVSRLVHVAKWRESRSRSRTARRKVAKRVDLDGSHHERKTGWLREAAR